MARSTLGSFLRGHTFGNVRQFDSVNAEALRRAWAAGAGPDPAKARHRYRLDDLLSALELKQPSMLDAESRYLWDFKMNWLEL